LFRPGYAFFLGCFDFGFQQPILSNPPFLAAAIRFEGAGTRLLRISLPALQADEVAG